jgi:hypothetical protein
MHKNLFEAIPDDHHQTVIVSAYIKDRIGRHIVSRIKKFPNVVEIPEFDMFQN